LRVPLYCVTDVRDITLRERIRDNTAMSWSVMPSARYPWAASPDRLSNGSTATPETEFGQVRTIQTPTATANAEARTAATPHQWRREPTTEEDGPSETTCRFIVAGIGPPPTVLSGTGKASP